MSVSIVRSFLLVVLFAIVLFGFKLGSYALIDMDEPRYPQAAREMIQRGDYIVPYFAEQPRYDKPILFYWAEILSLKTTMDNELGGRLPSAVSAILLVILCYFLGRTIGAPVLSALILATSLEFFVMARLSITDMLLNLCISATLIIFFLCYTQKLSNKFLVLASVCAALGVLCKGPVALALPGIIMIIYLLSEKDLISYFKRVLPWLPIMSLVFLLVVLPWYIAVHYATAGEFTRVFFLEHNLNRYTGVVSGHKAPWWFYLPAFLVGFLPWVIFLPKSIVKCFTERKANSYESKLAMFCLIWFLSVIVFYSIAGTKLINYILPCYLPLVMLVTLYIKKENWLNVKLHKFSFLLISFIALSAFVLLWFKIPSQLFEVEFIQHYLNHKLTLCMLVALAAIGIVCWFVKDGARAIAMMISFWTLCLLLAIPAVMMPLSDYMSAGIIQFATTLPEKAQIYTINMERPSVTYYTKKPALRITSDELLQKLGAKEHSYFVIKTKDLHMIDSAQNHYQIISQDHKYSFGKS